MRMGSLARLLGRVIRPSRYSEEVSGWADLVQAAFAGGGGGGGVIVVMVLGLPIPAGIAFALGGVLLMTLAAAHSLQVRLDVRDEKTPCLVFGSPRVRKVGIGPIAAGYPAVPVNTAIEMRPPSGSPALNLGQTMHWKGELLVGISQVANDPPNKVSEAQVNHALIEITFFSAAGKEEVRLHGRWTDNEQPGTRSHLKPIDDIRRRDLIPNGEPNYVDVALKYEEDDCCYAFNDETCRVSNDWRDPKNRLSDKEYRVRIVVKGVGLPKDKEEWLLLRNLGKGNGMALERSGPLALSKADSQSQ